MLGIKPMASLSSGLLARKGQARPAMRRPVLGGDSSDVAPAVRVDLKPATIAIEDDLGWNDMGTTRDEPAHPPADVTAPAATALPPVLQSRVRLETALAPGSRNDDLPRAAATTRKAAFTLRLDSERHLRLRLASAARHRSAQQLVTEALDALLATMPDIEGLRAQLPTDTPVRER